MNFCKHGKQREVFYRGKRQTAFVEMMSRGENSS